MAEYIIYLNNFKREIIFIFIFENGYIFKKFVFLIRLLL